jgi:asparagine synthase (glutamine-hydrolysing)
MTSHFGVFNTEGGHSYPADFQSMTAVLRDRPADSNHSWLNGSVALGQQSINITPESFNELLPLYLKEPGLTIAGDIRLDNREELFGRLDIPIGYRQAMGDAQLILEAYLKWQSKCPEYLIGNFAFTIWDDKKQTLFCCRDHFGERGLFYYHDRNKFIFASEVKVIAAVQGIKTGVNQHKLATVLNKDAKDLFRHETWYQNIFAIPAGTILEVNKKGISLHKYWEPHALPPLSFKNDDAFAEAFQDVLFKAVGAALRSKPPVTALLSGGLDSSAIVSVAARILKAQNKELQVFSSVLPDHNDNLLKDERYFIDQFLAVPNVKINYIAPQGSGFFSSVDRINSNLDSPNLSSRLFLYETFVQKAQSLGSKVILDGAGGEMGISNYSNDLYAELFWKFKWPLLWKEFKARKILTGERMSAIFKTTMLKPALPAPFIHLLKRSHDVSHPKDHFFTGNFAYTLRENIKPFKNEIKKASINHATLMHDHIQLLKIVQNKSSGFIPPAGPVEFRFPLKNKTLLEFCLAAPAAMKIKNGYQRNLVRIGLDGILPPEIQWRNTKTAFSPDYLRRYNSQLPQVKDFFEQIKLNDPIRDMIDIEKLKNLVNIPISDNEKDKYKEMIARDTVPEAVYLIAFLRRFKEFQITP